MLREFREWCEEKNQSSLFLVINQIMLVNREEYCEFPNNNKEKQGENSDEKYHASSPVVDFTDTSDENIIEIINEQLISNNSTQSDSKILNSNFEDLKEPLSAECDKRNSQEETSFEISGCNFDVDDFKAIRKWKPKKIINEEVDIKNF